MSAAARQEKQKEQAAPSPTSDVEEDSEERGSSSGSSEEGSGSGQGGLVFGNMRTRLRWDTGSRTLHLDVRQYLQNRRKLEAKYKGRLDTSSGHYQYTAQLQRLMNQNTPSLARIIAAERGVRLEGEDAIQPDTFLPAGLKTLVLRDWNLAPGIRLTTAGQATLPGAPAAAAGAAGAAAAAAAPGTAGGSGGSDSSALCYCLTLRKQPQVLLRRGDWDSWLEGKVDVELQPGQQAVGLRAAARLKVLRLNVTDNQDVRVAVGCDFITAAHSSSGSSAAGGGSSGGSAAGGGGVGSSAAGGGGVLTPYVRISETNWAVRLAKGSLAFTFEM